MARILVVDDEEHIRLLVANVLVQHGYEVDTASDGAEAIGELAKTNYDLMIIDRNMPKMSGIEAITVVRASRKFKGLRILMLTAERFPTNIVKAFESGIDGYMVKPFDLDGLLVKVEKILLQQRSVE
ncbi:MAG: response regulator [Elusimicrobiota bacterium]